MKELRSANDVWHFDRDAEGVFSKSHFIGEAMTDSDNYLFASAPDMYRELKKARQVIQYLIEDGMTGYLEQRDSIDAILAKAHGEI